MREQQLQSKIIKELEKQGAWVVKVISANKRGTPDLIACLNGKFYAIEVKAPGKLSTVSEIQKYQLKKITEAGGVAILSDNCVHALTHCV